MPFSSAIAKITWPFRIVIGIGLGVGFLAWAGADRLPANGNRPAVWTREPELKALSENKFRIAFFNIHAGKGTDGVLDLPRVARCIEEVQPDFVGLCEVRGARYGIPLQQAKELGELLNMPATFLASERQYWQPSYGNALLSRVQTGPIHKLPLPCTQERKYRLASLTSFQVGGKTVKVLSVHLDRVQDREAQLEHIFSLFTSLEEPAILMGDFNTCYHQPPMEKYLKIPGVHDALREHLGENDMLYRVDWMMMRGLKTTDAGVLQNDASDHPLVWAEFEIPAENEE